MIDLRPVGVYRLEAEEHCFGTRKLTGQTAYILCMVLTIVVPRFPVGWRQTNGLDCNKHSD